MMTHEAIYTYSKQVSEKKRQYFKNNDFQNRLNKLKNNFKLFYTYGTPFNWATGGLKTIPLDSLIHAKVTYS